MEDSAGYLSSQRIDALRFDASERNRSILCTWRSTVPEVEVLQPYSAYFRYSPDLGTRLPLTTCKVD